MYDVYFSPSFSRKLKKVIKKNPELKNKVKIRIKRLSKDPKHSSLKLHKLSGTDNWSFSIEKDLRVIVSIRKNKILCTKIGTHDEVY